MTTATALPPPPMLAPDWALFLDVDGTLLDFALSPGAVQVPESLIETLRSLHEMLDGALALVSGRELQQIDALFAPLQLPAVGLHGLQMRVGEHFAAQLQPPPPELLRVRDAARALAAKFPGALVEDKGCALALHWRGAPAAEEPLHEFANSELINLPGYHLQSGHDVIELRPDGAHKGDAIAALLDTPFFHGRRPLFIGDDLTDEHGFELINARDGISVLVGPRTQSAAHFGLRDPASVRAWLAEAARLLRDTEPARA